MLGLSTYPEVPVAAYATRGHFHREVKAGALDAPRGVGCGVRHSRTLSPRNLLF